VRRPVVGREPVARHPFAPRRRRQMPRWLRRFLVGQLLFLLVFTLLNELQKPTGLPVSTLVGPRLAPGPVCIEEAVDVSASMTSFTPQRERAEQELFAFARRELRPDDQISVAFFAGSAALALPPSALDALTTPPPVAGGLADGTLLTPAVDVLRAGRTAASDACVERALVVITDGAIFDGDEAAAAIANGSYARVYAVIPAATGWLRPGELDGPLRYVTVEHFTDAGLAGRPASMLVDAKPLDVVLGDVIGSLTGQQLQQRTR
jgi:hypothetical protein